MENILMVKRIIRLPEVSKKSGKSKSSIYRDMALGEFPKQIKLSERSSGWIESEVDQWIEARINASRIEVEG